MSVLMQQDEAESVHLLGNTRVEGFTFDAGHTREVGAYGAQSKALWANDELRMVGFVVA